MAGKKGTVMVTRSKLAPITPVWCHICDTKSEVNSLEVVNGWPSCCGKSMELESRFTRKERGGIVAVARAKSFEQRPPTIASPDCIAPTTCPPRNTNDVIAGLRKADDLVTEYVRRAKRRLEASRNDGLVLGCTSADKSERG